MRKVLVMIVSVLALLSTSFALPSEAAPRYVLDAGPTVSGCQTSVMAIVDDPANRLTLDHPLQLTAGIIVGAPGSPCGLTNLFLNADLYLLPVLGQRSLVATASSHTTCSTCSHVKSFGAATLPPGIYQVVGTVRQGSLANAPLATIVGRTFLYDGLDVRPM